MKTFGGVLATLVLAMAGSVPAFAQAGTAPLSGSYFVYSPAGTVYGHSNSIDTGRGIYTYGSLYTRNQYGLPQGFGTFGFTSPGYSPPSDDSAEQPGRLPAYDPDKGLLQQHTGSFSLYGVPFQYSYYGNWPSYGPPNRLDVHPR